MFFRLLPIACPAKMGEGNQLELGIGSRARRQEWRKKGFPAEQRIGRLMEVEVLLGQGSLEP